MPNNYQRPVVLEFRDAKAELVEAANTIFQKHRLPAFLARRVVEDMLNSIIAVEQQEIANAEMEEKNYMEGPHEK